MRHFVLLLQFAIPSQRWSVCYQEPGWSYTSTRANLPRDTYPYLLKNIPVHIYNGDWDR